VRPELSVVAKFLPALIDNANPAGAELALSTLVDLVLSLGTGGLGIEASLAQGFKRAGENRRGAARSAEARVDQLERFLEHATFWYSRLNAVQALALLADAARGGAVRASATAVIKRRRGDEHPFVRAAAGQALRAIDSGDPTRYTWHDEAVEMRRSGEGRSAGTSQLVADVVLVLNMNEQWFGRNGDPAARARLEATHSAVGRRAQLPLCMSGDRARLLDARRDPCDDERCGFHLCPYVWEGRSYGASPADVVALEHAHRGQPSAALCRHQRQLLTGHRLASWVGGPPAVGRKRALRRFWATMEQRARADEARARAMERV
jgi:hypothetical protein